MKLRTTLILFLLSFFLVGCYSDDLMLPEGNAEPNRMPITDRWATDVVEAEVPGWLGQAKGPPTDAERDAFVQADKERADAQLGEELSEEEAKVKLEAEQAKAEEEAKVKLEAERKAKAKAKEEAKIKIAENILKLKALNSCKHCNLFGAILTEADLSGANLTGANLTNADLTNADLTNADLENANLTNADLEDSRLSGANLTRANLTGADLTRTNLRGAFLRGANLTRASLIRANLRGAFLDEHYDRFFNKFFYTDLTGADFTGATLKDAKIEGAIFCNTKTPWGLDNSGCNHYSKVLKNN